MSLHVHDRLGNSRDRFWPAQRHLFFGTEEVGRHQTGALRLLDGVAGKRGGCTVGSAGPRDLLR